MGVVLKISKNGFPGAAAKMRGAIGVAFAEAKGPLLSDLNRRTPIDTGELRASESAESDDRSLTLRATAGHALVVHQGSHRMGGRPYMTDTVEAGVPTVMSAITKAAEAALR